ncbi:MAG: peptidyl-prolyl cis-trans isomerase [Myxococcota bacterium]
MATIFAAAACRAPAPTPTGCPAATPREGVAVARIGDTVLDVDDILVRLAEQGETVERRYHDPEALREFVQDQIRFELLARAAVERGLQCDPEVVRAARKVMVRKLLQRELDDHVSESAVAPEAVAAYYGKHQEAYRQPEMRRIAHIQLAPTEAGRAEAQSLIEPLQRKSVGASAFARLAQRRSTEHESAPQGGEIPFQTQATLTETYGLTFAGEVFALASGALASTPVQSTRGWHVVKVLAVREARVRELDAVRAEIHDQLVQQARSRAFDEYLKAIRERYPIVLDEGRLADVRARLTGIPEVSSP